MCKESHLWRLRANFYLGDWGVQYKTVWAHNQSQQAAWDSWGDQGWRVPQFEVVTMTLQCGGWHLLVKEGILKGLCCGACVKWRSVQGCSWRLLHTPCFGAGCCASRGRDRWEAARTISPGHIQRRVSLEWKSSEGSFLYWGDGLRTTVTADPCA